IWFPLKIEEKFQRLTDVHQKIGKIYEIKNGPYTTLPLL
ncbi:unnamed protein product, partial [Larinioides sclopetarius]